MTKTVGIIGLAGAGKDTVAGYLTHLLGWYGMKVKTFSFAWAVREITLKTGLLIYDREKKEQAVRLPCGWQDKFHDSIDTVLGRYAENSTRVDLYAYTCNALHNAGYYRANGDLICSPRQFAQILGTEGGRSISEDFWVDILMAKIAAASPDVALIPDTRFENEALRCDLLLPVMNPNVKPVNEHPSEQLARQLCQRGGSVHALLSKPMIRVDNSGSLNNLKAQAANVSTVLFRDAGARA